MAEERQRSEDDLWWRDNHRLSLNEMIEGCHVVTVDPPVIYEGETQSVGHYRIVCDLAVENRFGERDSPWGSYANCWEHCAPRQYDRSSEASMRFLRKMWPERPYDVTIAYAKTKPHYRAMIAFTDQPHWPATGIAPTGPRALAKALYYLLKHERKL
jgi:hypothetical protein